MLEVANDKLTERERECVKHIRQARERGMSFAEYCRSAVPLRQTTCRPNRNVTYGGDQEMTWVDILKTLKIEL